MGLWVVVAAAVTLAFAIPAHGVRFQDVTATAGFNYNGESTGASFVDFNNDGRQDVWSQHHRRRSGLYRNNGNGTFTNVILQMDGSQKLSGSAFGGIDTHGAAWADFDNDGDQDLYPANGIYTPVFFYVNYGNVMMEESQQRNVTDDAGAWGGSWFDYDRDGLLDLMQNKIFGSKTLRGLANHRFQNVSRTQGSCDDADYSQIYDIDADGRWEVICIKGKFVDKALRITPPPFRDITHLLPSIPTVVDTAIADFDNDGRTDTYLQIGRVQPSEARKTGDRKAELFAGVTAQEKGMRFNTSGNLSIRLTTEHFDQSQIFIGSAGWHPTGVNFTLNANAGNVNGIKNHTPGTKTAQGLYVGKTGTNQWEIYFSSGPSSNRGYVDVTSSATVSNVVGLNMDGTDRPRKPKLLMNKPGGLLEQSASRGLTQPVTCKSAAAADYDNDGDVDLFLACGISVSNLPNLLYLNNGNGHFSRANNHGGEGAVGAGLANKKGAAESVVTADYDNDGRMDVFVTNGSRLSPIKLGGPEQLFRNVTNNGNDWVKLRLIGRISNRDALGAKVYATTGSRTQLREQHGGFHRWSQDGIDIHFGFGNLGANPTINRIRVEWPNGSVDTFNNVAANRFYKVTERASAGGSGSIQPFNLGPVPPLETATPGKECNRSFIDATQDKGIYIARNCPNGAWTLIAIAGGSGSNINYRGTITANGNLGVQNKGSLEGGDSATSNGNTINFNLTTRAQNIDQFDFTVPNSASSICVDVTRPTGTQTVYIGPRALPVGSLPVNLRTMGACGGGGGPGGGARLGDYVWRDNDGDGIQDGNEPGLGGVSVSLLDCSGNFLNSTTSAGDGSYGFNNLNAGNYMLQFQAPSNFNISPAMRGNNPALNSDPDPANGLTACVSMTAAQSRTGLDAGFTPQGGGNPPPTGGARIGDYVWRDNDGDGRQDPSEPGLAGVTVRLQDCSNNTLATTTTAANGSYLFDRLGAGDYVIQFVLPPNYRFSPRGIGSGGQNSDPYPATGKTLCQPQGRDQVRIGIDAGMIPQGGGNPPPGGSARIGDYVWRDNNGNGRQDGNEPGLGGVTVRLQDCSNNTLATTTTAANGSYLFDRLGAGDYLVQFVLPQNYRFSPRGIGSGGQNSDPYPATGKTLCQPQGRDQIRIGIDAGMIPQGGGNPPSGGNARIGDFVWRDHNRNGRQDAGEPGIAGVTVRLQDCNARTLVTTTTSNNGRYLFDELGAGDYVVQFILPPNHRFSPRGVGSGGQNSDPFPATGKTLCQPQSRDQVRIGIDAGMIRN